MSKSKEGEGRAVACWISQGRPGDAGLSGECTAVAAMYV